MKKFVATLAILGAALFALFGLASCMAALEEQEPRPTASFSPTPTDEPTYEPTEGGEAGTDPSEPAPAQEPSAYYANCDAARSAGVAPLARDEPGYRSGLDRNNDGIACE